ncbi:MAG: Hsp70 family protein, partial [Lachnospiraceae bacterium]|nr:Hsp70 family protein [Lachnospiraceae bacterium]
RLDGIAPAPRGIPQIEVTFDIDANGIVNVSAKDLGTGKEQHITITAGSNMSDADIEKAIKEAKEFEAQDKKKKEAVETINEAESFAMQTEKALSEVGDKVSDSERSTVQADVDAVKAILDRVKADPANASDSDLDALKAAKEKLTNSAQGVFTKMYENIQQAQGGAAGAGPDMSGMGGMGQNAGSGAGSSAGGNDDVIDGDFREV